MILTGGRPSLVSARIDAASYPDSLGPISRLDEVSWIVPPMVRVERARTAYGSRSSGFSSTGGQSVSPLLRLSFLA
jgi:hypothetical protein